MKVGSSLAISFAILCALLALINPHCTKGIMRQRFLIVDI